MAYFNFDGDEGLQSVFDYNFHGLNKLERERELPKLYSTPFEKYYINYLIIGGMPEAVQAWVDTHDYKEAEEVQNRILKDYADDFGKYTTPETATKIKMIWDSIPSQIARDNSKFIFSHVKEGARSKNLEDALGWLVNAGIVLKLDMVSNPEIPLACMADSTYFKIYMSDVGLLRKKANVNYRSILEGNDAFIHFKGALAENYIYVQLKCMGITPYFWRTKADAEMDFITDYEGELIPIEVKSADNTKAKSLHLFCNRYKPRIAFKKSSGNSRFFKCRDESVPFVYAININCKKLQKVPKIKVFTCNKNICSI